MVAKNLAPLKSRSQLPAHARCLALRRETPSLWPSNGSNRRSTAAPLKVLPHFTPVGSCNHAATAGIKSPGSGLLGEALPSCPATLATNCTGTSAFTQHSQWLRNQCGLTCPPIPTALAASTRPHAHPHCNSAPNRCVRGRAARELLCAPHPAHWSICEPLVDGEPPRDHPWKRATRPTVTWRSRSSAATVQNPMKSVPTHYAAKQLDDRQPKPKTPNNHCSTATTACQHMQVNTESHLPMCTRPPSSLMTQ